MSSRAIRSLPTGAGDAEPVSIAGAAVTIHELTVEDAGLADLLAAHPASDRAQLVSRALAVGARGLLTMGLGIDVAAVDARVRETVASALDESERRIGELITAGERAFAEHFDPEHRTSLLGRALQDFTGWRDDLMRLLDPAGSDSHTTAFLERLSEVLGPEGVLEARLATALDPEADGSALARLAESIRGGFTELRDLIVHGRGHDQGRIEEATRGTAQGLDFEDTLEETLRSEAAALGGCVLERVSREPGTLGPNATVGDLVLTLVSGQRIVFEAKNQATIGLAGRDGILAELDRAAENRKACFAICVSARDAFPREVGSFSVYGDRLLVVDDGEGTMVRVAVRWAAAALTARAKGRQAELDAGYLSDRLDRIRTLAERFKSSQRTLTDVGKSVDAVRETLREMRVDLIDLVEDVRREVAGAGG